jgi:hypothetical protein
MINYDKVRVNPEITQSLTFYFMMSIYLRAHEVSEHVATESLQSFIKDCREAGFFRTAEAEAAHLAAAYDVIPSGFLELMGVEGGLGDGIKRIDTKYAWVNKL